MTRFGLQLWSQQTGWPAFRDSALAAETAGWDSVWTWDHLNAIFGPWEQPIFEGWSVLAALGPLSSRLRLGLMVGANTFRNPGHTAKLATTLAHGFAMISRFFPGSRAELAAIDDEVIAAVSGPPKPGKAQSFEDQYISSGGQLYELMAGHDRFVADLRPLFERRRAGGAALCCHPYDLCTELIARELGVLVTDEQGSTLAAPLDVTSDVGWIGYANAALKALVEPHLRQALTRRGLID